MEITNIDNFLKYYSRIKFRTRRLFDYIPKDKIEWTYLENKFTIGDIIRHMANIERWMYAENAQFKPSLYDGCGVEYADGFEAVIKYYNDLQQQSFEIFSKLTPEDLNKKCMTPGDAEIPLWKWLRAMVEHETHHRGQLYFYLGMLGVKTPPMFGLTSEEVASRSAHRKKKISKKKKEPFKVLFYLKGKEQSIIEIKRTDIKSEKKSKIFYWFIFDKKEKNVDRLIFVSMKNNGEMEEREFTEGKLVFGPISGQFSDFFGEKLILKNKTLKPLPKKIRKAIIRFLEKK